MTPAGSRGAELTVQVNSGGRSEIRERFSEHSLRVSGAQLFARLGWDVAVIMALGRWGSDAIKAYVQSVPLNTKLQSGLGPADDVQLRARFVEVADLVKSQQRQLEALLAVPEDDKRAPLPPENSTTGRSSS